MRLVPTRGMKFGPLEIINAWDRRPHQFVEHPKRTDHDRRFEHFAGVGFHPPATDIILPSQTSHAGVESHMATDVVFVRAVIQVLQDLRLTRERPRPVELRFEREGIEMRLHIAFGPRILAMPSRTADAARLLKQHKILDPDAFKINPHAQRSRAGADDDDLISKGRWGRSGAWLGLLCLGNRFSVPAGLGSVAAVC